MLQLWYHKGRPIIGGYAVVIFRVVMSTPGPAKIPLLKVTFDTCLLKAALSNDWIVLETVLNIRCV